MKKGQMLSQPFIYIFALILGSLILVWGIKTIYDLKEKGELVELGTFVKGMEKEVNKFFYYDEGASRNIVISMPGKIKHLCVFDPDTYTEGMKCTLKLKTGEMTGRSCNILDDMFNPRLKAEARHPDKADNIFFLPSTATEISRYRIQHLKPIDGKILCYVNGAKMNIESKSTYVEAS